MSFVSVPDIAGMLVLMAVLGWFRRRHRDARVDGWLLGLCFILIEMVAASIHHGARWLPMVTHVVSLDAYLLAAAAFGWAARRDLLPGTSHLGLYLLPSLPMFALATIFGLGVVSPRPYVWVTAGSLVAGLVCVLFMTRLRRRTRRWLVVVHLVIWLPMLYLGLMGKALWVVYWSLACLYVLAAFSFRRRARKDCIGAWVIMVSFVIWAMCFLGYPLAEAHPEAVNLIQQVWNIQKFFVVIGMLLVLLEDETQRRRDEAMHDALTGLPNRRLFDDRLTLALERSRRTGLSTVLFAIDLNGFKQVNDTYGHHVGDTLLKRVADRLKRKVRGADTIARCGGDEFMVIVNDLVRPQHCARIADALRSAIEGVEVPEADGPRLGGSVGYAIFPDDSEDVFELCQLADVRMYQDKRAGQRVEV